MGHASRGGTKMYKFPFNTHYFNINSPQTHKCYITIEEVDKSIKEIKVYKDKKKFD